jgi:hypothetical protein
MMRLFCLMFSISVLIVILVPRVAHAQATRTWVSGVGDDANPCSRTAPCKTFAGAISKTAAGGEIDALDPGGFGAVTITKAITIDGGGGIVASVLAAGTNGINVSAGANDIVLLRNLSINGAGTGINGINYMSGKTLIVEHSIVMGFSSNGINAAPTAVARITISDSTVANNANAMSFTTANSTGSLGVVVSNVLATDNSGIAVGATVPAGKPGLAVFIDRLMAVFNGTGVSTSGALVRLANSTITDNSTGVSQTNGGTATSYKNNQINDNGVDGTPLTAVGLN